MKLINQSKQGIHIASSSFTLLWQHASLLVYSAIPIVIQVILELMIYNILVSPPEQSPIALAEFDMLALFIARIPNWLHYLGLLSIIFISFFIMLFFNAALIHHTMYILHYKASSIRENISAVKRKSLVILWWTLFSLIPLCLLQATQGSLTSTTPWYYATFMISLSIAMSALWSLITLFVMPIITVENKSIGAALIKSFAILKQYFIQTLSGEAFFGFLTFSAFSVSLLFGSLYPLLALSYARILIALASIFIRCILTTAHTIFKTIIYDEYTSPERELPFLS